MCVTAACVRVSLNVFCPGRCHLSGAADKKLITFEGGHRNPVTRPDLLGEILMWFDHYLGPVNER